MNDRVTLLLLTYNQAHLVREAAESCLQQVGPPIDIVLSDDASTDDTWAVLQSVTRAYAGPHRLVLRRNPVNLGIAGHYNALVAEIETDLYVTAAGDDLCEPDRVQRLVQAWQAGGRRVDLLASHVRDIDAQGAITGLRRVDDLAAVTDLAQWGFRRQFVIGATHAFTRRMMQRFGPMALDVHYEDQVMWLRALLGGGGVTVDLPLVRYRSGGTSGRPDLYTAADYTRFTRREAVRTRAEVLQLRQDAAACAGALAPVESATAEPLARARFMLAVIDAQGLRAKWAAARAEGVLTSAWLFRKFFSLAFPEAVAWNRRLKARFRRRKSTGD